MCSEVYKKVCTKCFIEKPVTDFFKDKQKPTGYRPDCKKCNTAKSSLWARNNPDKRKGYSTKFLYGVDGNEYRTMLHKQASCCAICKRHRDTFNKEFAVDHDHITLQVRGLLCGNCNSALGKFQDNIEILNNAISYLKEYK